MKFILMLLFIVSCGKKSNERPYLFKSDRFESNWQSRDGERVLIDNSTVTFMNVMQGASSSDCVFSYEIDRYNDFYSTLYLSNLVGDSYVCSSIPVKFGAELVFDSARGLDVLKILGKEYLIY